MKSIILILLFSFSFLFDAQAQYREPSSGGGGFGKKIYFGGGGGFSAGSNYLNLSVSPLVGYKVTDRFSAGIQATYQFAKFFEARANNYGGGPFLRFNITQKFFTYTQYEYMNYGLLAIPPDTGERFDFRSFFVGLGYTEPIGKHLAFNVTALYNLLYKDGTQSPYRSPFVFRVGIVAGMF